MMHCIRSNNIHKRKQCHYYLPIIPPHLSCSVLFCGFAAAGTQTARWTPWACGMCTMFPVLLILASSYRQSVTVLSFRVCCNCILHCDKSGAKFLGMSSDSDTAVMAKGAFEYSLFVACTCQRVSSVSVIFVLLTALFDF